MTEARLSNVLLLHAYKDYTDQLNLNKTAEVFASLNGPYSLLASASYFIYYSVRARVIP